VIVVGDRYLDAVVYAVLASGWPRAPGGEPCPRVSAGVRWGSGPASRFIVCPNGVERGD
jgi:hypothetical protein